MPAMKHLIIRSEPREAPEEPADPDATTWALFPAARRGRVDS